jgi:Multicopper oxidase
MIVLPRVPRYRTVAGALALALSLLLTCGARLAAGQEMAPPALEAALPAPEEAPPAPPPDALVLEGTLSEYFIYLPQLTSNARTVRFVVENVGLRRHNLRVVGNGVDRVTPALRAGQSGEVEVFFADPGPYTVYCDIGDHADQGMTTGFYVEGPFTGS